MARLRATLGGARLGSLVQADPGAELTAICDRDPVWIGPDADVIDVAVLMTDYNLTTIRSWTPDAGARIAVWLSVGLAAGLAASGIWLRLSRARHGAASVALVPRQERNQWRMPPLALLKPVTWSPALKLAMIALLGYLVVAALLLLIKAIQLGTG